MTRTWTLLKLGGELLEDDAAVAQASQAIASLAGRGPLVVVHGGGRDIDAECMRRAIPKRAVDGLRITDEAVLEAVIAALAGTVNTRLVGALVTLGLPAVGLTGVDDRLGLADRAPSYTSASGQSVDLGLVGVPATGARARLVVDLVEHAYLPVVATLGISSSGKVLNVNADVLAAHLAVNLPVARLLIAGGTHGVLDASGHSIDSLTPRDAAQLKHAGTVSVGMVAKLDAAFGALQGGVPDVRIVTGRAPDLLSAAGTRLDSTSGSQEIVT